MVEKGQMVDYFPVLRYAAVNAIGNSASSAVSRPAGLPSAAHVSEAEAKQRNRDTTATPRHEPGNPIESVFAKSINSDTAIDRLLYMWMTKMKRRLLFAFFVMWFLCVPTDVRCQVQKALDDSAAMSWLTGMVSKAVAEGKDSFLEDEYLRKSLLLRGRSPIGTKVNQIGKREIAVERFFWTVQAMRNRFWRDPLRNFQWNLMMTDLTVTGRVLSVSKEEEVCVYGTQVDIQVGKYQKGTGPDTIEVKLVRGRKIGERSFILSSGEPQFEVGEEILLQLSATPAMGHCEVAINATPDCLGFFYRRNTGGEYYEVAGVMDAKRTIVDGKLVWRGETLSLADVEAILEADLKVTF